MSSIEKLIAQTGIVAWSETESEGDHRPTETKVDSVAADEKVNDPEDGEVDYIQVKQDAGIAVMKTTFPIMKTVAGRASVPPKGTIGKSGTSELIAGGTLKGILSKSKHVSASVTPLKQTTIVGATIEESKSSPMLSTVDKSSAAKRVSWDPSVQLKMEKKFQHAMDDANWETIKHGSELLDQSDDDSDEEDDGDVSDV